MKKSYTFIFTISEMRFLLSVLIILFNISLAAQTPYLSILIKIDSVKAEGTRYKIEMNICEPKKMAERGDWFTHDTSKINFTSLKVSDIECGEYFDKGMPTLISGDEEEKKINQFQFSNQVFAWEKIFVFKISNASSRGWMPEMYVVIPMKYKSFVTHIKLTALEFQSGKVIFLRDINNEQKGMYLTIEQSLKNYQRVDVKDFPLKSILEKN